jgi:hypothetical protein
VARDGSGNFTAGTITAALTGNASTATALETARTIGGVSFDGTANINLPGVNTAGDQDTSGNAATATKLDSSRTFEVTGDVTGTVSSDLTSGASIATSIASGVIVDADVNASAAIAGTKISPDFGSQNVVTTGDVQSASINGGPLAGMRNAIINGNFDIWQRGTSFTGSEYGADRWSVNAGGGTLTLSRQPFTLGQTSVPGNPSYFARLAVTAAATTSTSLRQYIEGVSSFAGAQITVSFWAKADAAKTIWVGHLQYFGTGGSPSNTVSTAGQLVTLSTSWARYSVTTTLPSVSGKTLGTDGNDWLSVHFIVSDSTTALDWSPIPAQTITFDIAQVQLEAGPVATPFERRPIGTELALCQRYFQRNSNAATASQFSGDVTNGSLYQAVTHFATTMRVIPNVALAQSGAVAFAATSGTATPSVHGIQEQRTATGTGRGAFLSSFTADAEL